MTKTRIALIQMKMSSDQKKNMGSAIKKIKEACKKKAKIICLPELFLSNYFCQQEKHSNFNLAEKIPGKTTNTFCLLAKELKVILINLSDKVFVVEKGLRIAQMVLCPVVKASLKEVEELENTERGSGGFGSTGI